MSQQERGDRPPRPARRREGSQKAVTPAELGRRGEAWAARFLEERGWEVLGRNVREGHAEVDLVARKDDVVAFVEVKCRRGKDFGHPLEAITWRKRREIARVARGWIRREGIPPGTVIRFDAIAVLLQPSGPPEVHHLADAWRLD